MIKVILVIIASLWITGFARLLMLFFDDYEARHPDLEEFRLTWVVCSSSRKIIIALLVLALIFVMAPWGLLFMITDKHP